MKKKMCVFIISILISCLFSSMGQFEELQLKNREGVELLLSRLDYGTSIAFLPYNLAIGLSAMADFPLRQVVYSWDAEMEDWVPSFQYDYTYEGDYLTQYVASITMQGMVYEMTVDYFWEDGYLMENETTTYFMEIMNLSTHEYYNYTDAGVWESYLQQGWDANSETWLDIEQTNCTIVDGKITMMVKDEYDYELMEWRPEERLTYTWDGELITSQFQEYNDGDGWYNVDMNYMYYYESGLMDYIMYQIWQNDDWEDEHRTTFTYENNLNVLMFTEAWVEGSWVNDEQEIMTYDDQDRRILIEDFEYMVGEWLNESETYIYYTLDNSIDEVPQPDVNIQIFPNPFNPSTLLSWQINGAIMPGTLNVYDLRGRKVDELSVTTGANGKGSVEWNAEGFASGLYFFKLSSYKKCSKGLLLK